MKNLYDEYVDRLCCRFIKKTDLVFDCGCGDGQKTMLLSKYSDNVIGGDLDNRTKKEYKIKFKKISLDNYGAKDSYDFVTAFDVIEHVDDDISFVKELLKITKEGGHVIIGTPNRDRLSNKITSLIHGPIIYPRILGYHYESGGDICHLREYIKLDFIKLLKKIPEAKIVELNSYFVGLYTPFGPLGFKVQNKKICKYAQHLFLIIQKVSSD